MPRFFVKNTVEIIPNKTPHLIQYNKPNVPGEFLPSPIKNYLYEKLLSMSKKLYHFWTALFTFLTNCWHFFHGSEINVRCATIHPKCIKFNDPKILFFWLADPKEQSRKQNSTKHWMSCNILICCFCVHLHCVFVVKKLYCSFFILR